MPALIAVVVPLSWDLFHLGACCGDCGWDAFVVLAALTLLYLIGRGP